MKGNCNNPFAQKCFPNGLDKDFSSFVPPKTLDEVLKDQLDAFAGAKAQRQVRLDQLAAQNAALCKDLGIC